MTAPLNALAWPCFDTLADGRVRQFNGHAERLGITVGMGAPQASALMSSALHGLRWQQCDEHTWRCQPALAEEASTLDKRLLEARLKLHEEVRRRRYLERQLMTATENEQRRISLELHDGLGQHLSGLAFTARSLAEQLAEEGNGQAKEAEWLARLLRDAVGHVRAMSRGLWPVSLERHSLPSALASLAGDIERLFRVSVQVHADGFEADTAPVAHHLFRITQEAIHNAVKHGNARNIEVRLERAPEQAMLSVVSDGSGLNERSLRSTPGLGVVGMQLRADALGGELSIESLPAGGVEVCLVWQPRNRSANTPPSPSAPAGRPRP